MKNIKYISLVLTRRCNLQCFYCYENYKTKDSMCFDVAKAALKKHFSDAAYDEVVIEFFGGEPFLEFELMRKIFEYVENQTWDKPYHFSTITNGTLIHGETQSWLITHRNKYHVTLSLDGTKEMHDCNRSKSYSRIDIDFFRRYYPDQPVKMTLSQATLPSLAQGVKHIHSLGFKIENNLAYGLDWSNAENLMIFQRELMKLIDFYLENPQLEPCGLLSMYIEGVMTKEHPKKWCGAGTNMVAVDIDGMEYPCQSFLPMSIGDEKAKSSRCLNFGEIQELVDENCEHCILLPVCPTCYGSNFSIRDSTKIRDRSLCNFTKMRAFACSYLQAQRILLNKGRSPLRMSEIDSVLRIQNELALSLSSVLSIEPEKGNDNEKSIYA